jgi:UDP-2,4-diacetamido-2,4,6-trideoxy-beta-L-altropyranose hydrolase
VGDGLNRTALVIADAGAQAGLGHVSRSGAVAVALRARGYELECRAFGIVEPLQRDGLNWSPLDDVAALQASRAALLLLDSYRLDATEVRAAAQPSALVLMHDASNVQPGTADLQVTVPPANHGSEHQLSGARYACLRPVFWGLAPRTPPARVGTVLVSAGSNADAGSVAAATRSALPDARIRLVRGPFADSDTPAGIEVLDRPDSLLEPLLEADLVVTAGGQTMLEAVATGTPCVAFAQVENQRRQLDYLAELGAVEAADGDLPGTVARIAASPEQLRELSLRGSEVIDGFGALRVAFAADAIAERRRP